MSSEIITALGFDIRVYVKDFENNFISLTDIAKYKNPDEPRDIIQNWMRNKDTIDFLGLWEELNNPNFNRLEFEAVKQEAGHNAFFMSPQKWIKTTGAIGITTKSGRYDSGTFAYSDIAFEFASWISPEFKLYIIKDYQRLKLEEKNRQGLSFDVQREISKMNYKIHTDAIKENIIIPNLTPQQVSYIYANEADILNVALFGMTAREWRDRNPDKKGNIRDYASVKELLILSNMESYNSILINNGIPQSERLTALRKLVLNQLKSLEENTVSKALVRTDEKKFIQGVIA